MPARKTSTKQAPPPCPGCAGEGWVRETHTVGRGKKSRPAGEVEVLCPTCLGTGTAAQ
ncbi:hypothetical protein [Kitasatospora sp. DSM 101779]|uniref:hypothetical protein n=1 Tax=Kitasatospora sp. DSM 101779 TaxID=2853165 RepID=UPI0021DB318C|nr:hypothetical protein [Kitasatospora sp. DSM 101779]MCU7824798.1 hypothetical protein [Kitasatospora sp. DSM 101779]